MLEARLAYAGKDMPLTDWNMMALTNKEVWVHHLDGASYKIERRGRLRWAWRNRKTFDYVNYDRNNGTIRVDIYLKV